jgi:hypothetical protein
LVPERVLRSLLQPRLELARLLDTEPPSKILGERNSLLEGGMRLTQPVEKQLLLSGHVCGLAQHQPGCLA